MDISKKCSFCNFKIKNLDKYAQHIVLKHIAKLKFCQSCFRAFTNTESYNNHTQLHSSQNNRVKCSCCPILFFDKDELSKHEYEKHQESDGTILKDIYSHLSSFLNCNVIEFITKPGKKVCKFCKYSTNDVKAYIKHLATKECKCFACEICYYVSQNKSHITRHISSIHLIKIDVDSERKVLKCEICQKKFVKKTNFVKHKKECLNKDTQIMIKPSMVKCRYCEREKVGVNNFKKHVIFSHSQDYQDYRFNCVYCGRLFNHPKKLFAHFAGGHSNLKPYACNICGLKFSKRGHFTIHIKMKHNSVGFVEFTKNLHVEFNETQSENAFKPAVNENLFTEDEQKMLDEYEDLNGPIVVSSSNGNKSKTVTVKKPRNLPSTPHIVVANNSSSTLTNTKEGRVCTICKQRFYKLQIYFKHMSMHFREKHRCVKCLKSFDSELQLHTHYSENHSETAKAKALEVVSSQTKTENFRKTIYKVPYQITEPAHLKPCSMTAKDFIDNYNTGKKNLPIISSIDIKLVSRPPREPLIKMNEIKIPSSNSPINLRKPERIIFAQETIEPAVINAHYEPIAQEEYITPCQFDDIQDDFIEDNYTNEPEESESQYEVPVENVNTEEQRNDQISLTIEHMIHKKQLKNYAKVSQTKPLTLSIAHLVPEAPYYKIVEVKTDDGNVPEPDPEPEEILPDEQVNKLVHTNPLSHLIDEGTVKKLFANKRYYIPKISNGQHMVAKALQKLKTKEKNESVRKIRNKKKDKRKNMSQDKEDVATVYI